MKSWLLTFSSVGMEAAISFEEPAYKVNDSGLPGISGAVRLPLFSVLIFDTR